jgi:thiamine-phosphate pyrophosphorylase
VTERTEVFRIIDAAANRTREGLRVIEDFLRFGRNDSHLCRRLKEHRHELTSILAQFPASELLAARDTLCDVGTTIATDAEYQRKSPIDVVRAAFKRVQEALRTLEEYGKVFDPHQAAHFEQLRYQLYTTEKAVLRSSSARDQLREAHVYLLVAADQCRLGFETVVKQALDAGVQVIQLREKIVADRELIRRARQLRQWTREAGALLIINDRPDLAILSDADGVHVGQTELSVADARSIVGPDRLVGVSTHSIDQARQAELDGADYLGIGPTFPSQTKSFVQFPGLEFVRQATQEITRPWFAIGGIDNQNVAKVAASGATRIAVSGAVCESPCPQEAIEHLMSALKQRSSASQSLHPAPGLAPWA